MTKTSSWHTDSTIILTLSFSLLVAGICVHSIIDISHKQAFMAICLGDDSNPHNSNAFALLFLINE